MKIRRKPRFVLASLVTLALLAGRATAQVASPDTPPPVDTGTDEEAVVLSPFVVNSEKDKGYRATNTTSGTRLNTPIKDLPLNLEVITNEFLRDTGATNLREALRYSAGVVLESQSDAYSLSTDPANDSSGKQTAGANDPRGATSRPGDSTIKMRGFVIDQVLRDGFRRQYSADWINIERVDVLRGPSALLYGVGSFGGVVNYIPKRPRQKQLDYFGITVGTHGLYRGEFDVTGPLGDSKWKPAYRVTGAYQEGGDHTQYYNSKHWMISPVFEFKLTPKTTVLFDNEFGYSQQSGNGFQNIRSNLGNQAEPNREAEWMTDDTHGLINTRTFRWSGSDTFLKGPYRNNIIDITHQVGDDLTLKVGIAQSEATFDSRQINAGAGPNSMDVALPANYYVSGQTVLGGQTLNIRDALTAAKADPSGKYAGLYSPQDIFAARRIGAFRGDKLFGFVREQFSSNIGANANIPETNDAAVIWYQWRDYNRVETRDQVRAEAAYNLDLGKLGKHTFLAGMQYMGLKSDEEEFGPAHSYRNITTNVPVTVRYEDQYNLKNPQDYSVFRYGAQGDGLPDIPNVHLNNLQTKTWDLGYYAVYQGKFLKDRLSLIGGARWDRSDAREVQTYIYQQGHDPAVRGPGSPGTLGETPTATSPQVGLSFSITPNLSVFGLYSTGVVPNPYAADGNGNILKPTKAKNKEIGLKFDLLEGRISGTVSAYEITRTGQPKYIWWAPSPYKSIQSGWDPAKPNAILAGFATPDAMYKLIHETEGKSVAEGLALAKRIWPAGWYPLLDEVAAAPTPADAYAGPEGQRFWTWDLSGLAFSASQNTYNYDPSYTGNLWFPLMDLTDPDVVKGLTAIRSYNGWNGNYSVDAGNTFRWQDGRAGLTNGPGASGAFVPMNDEARGWDASIILTPADWLQVMVNYAHVKRKVTSKTYQFVSLTSWPFGEWMTKDVNRGTYSYTRPPSEVYTDLNDTATYHALVPDYNNPVDDTPENTASIWLHSNLGSLIPKLKGWEIGGGGQWEDKRMWFSGFDSGGGVSTLPGAGDINDPATLVQLFTKQRYTVNMMVAYSTKIAGRYNWRVSLNVDNLLDDQKRYGLVYAPGRTVRFSNSITF